MFLNVIRVVLILSISFAATPVLRNDEPKAPYVPDTFVWVGSIPMEYAEEAHRRLEDERYYYIGTCSLGTLILASHSADEVSIGRLLSDISIKKYPADLDEDAEP